MPDAVSLPSTQGYSWRAADPADAAAVSELLRECDARDGTADARASADLPPAGAIVATGTAGLVAAGWIEHRYGSRWQLCGAVRPDDRRRDLGSALIAWLRDEATARAADFGGEQALRIDRVLHVYTEGLPRDAASLYERAGLRFNYIEDEMHRDLRAPIGDASTPDGIAIVPWTPAMHSRIREAYNDAFATRGFGGYDERAWDRRFSPGEFAPAHSYCALDGEVIVGFLFSELPPDGFGWIDNVGVRSAYRGRGIACALLVTAMNGYAASGIEGAALRVNADNSPAASVYRRLGFAVERRHISYAAPVPDD